MQEICFQEYGFLSIKMSAEPKKKMTQHICNNFPVSEWVNKLVEFLTQKLFQICACMSSVQKVKTTMFTYSHANTLLGQSEHAYYLSLYFIKATVGLL